MIEVGEFPLPTAEVQTQAHAHEQRQRAGVDLDAAVRQLIGVVYHRFPPPVLLLLYHFHIHLSKPVRSALRCRAAC